MRGHFPEKSTSQGARQRGVRGFLISAWFVMVGLGIGVPAQAQTSDQANQFQPSITVEVLQRRIAEVEAATDMQDEARTSLLETYNKALNYLNEAQSYQDRAATYSEALQVVPAQLETVQSEIDSLKALEPTTSLTVGSGSTREQLVQALKQEEADLAGAEAQRANLQEQIAFQNSRLGAIDQRLTEVRRRQEETAAALAAPVEGGDGRISVRALGWVLESRYAALAAEVTSLDLERRSQPLRLGLLEARRNRQTALAEVVGARVSFLGELVNRRRQNEAETAAAEAVEVLGELKGQHPKLYQLSQDNAELSRQLSELIGELDQLEKEKVAAEKLTRQVEADHQDAETAVTDGAKDDRLGSLLLELQEYLPDVQVFRNRAESHGDRIGTAGVRRLRHQSELRYLADPSPIMAELEAEADAQDLPRLRTQMQDVVKQRQELLARALEADEVDLRLSRDLAAAESKLLETVDDYTGFLSGHLLWMQTTEPSHIRDLVKLPAEFRTLLGSPFWSQLNGEFLHRLIRSFIFWITLIAAIVLLWKRSAMIARLEKYSPQGLRPDRDSFTFTIRALVMTLAVPASLPLLLAGLGWHFKFTAGGGDIFQEIGATLLFVALHLYILRVLWVMGHSQGLFMAHFGWPVQAVALFRTQLERFTWIFVLSVLVTRLAIDLNPGETGGTIARLGFLVYAIVTALFYYHVLHPRRGVLTMQPPGQEKTFLVRLMPLWWFLFMASPLALAVITWLGYLYSAGVLYGLFQKTQWLIVGLILLLALATRWLLVIQRRLAYEAAVEKRQAEWEAKKAEMADADGEDAVALQAEEPEVDIDALSDDSRELLKVGAVGLSLVGLSALWSQVLPALSILNDVTLWYRTVTVDGEVERIPITLASAGLALIFGFGAHILARRLPAFLEITLIRAGVSSGGRYTATTLTRYAIIAVGAYLVFNTLGARWGQFQWLVAALGVGIGFGLQEIVANFISGLMMLFERPLRVGDIVTVGDLTGVVTRIQIRATTIRTWDFKELVVPNQEFITGRLLNWTLSNKVIRFTIEVGVAYGTNVDLALKLMKEVAVEHERILDDPAPILTFDSFGDSALILSMRVYVTSIEYRMATATALHKAINQKFEDAGIVIAFPQRHLHIQGVDPFRVVLDEGGADVPGEDGS